MRFYYLFYLIIIRKCCLSFNGAKIKNIYLNTNLTFILGCGEHLVLIGHSLHHLVRYLLIFVVTETDSAFLYLSYLESSQST